MKKALVILLAITIAMGIGVLAGCGSSKTTVNTGNGSIGISTPKGSVELKKKAPTEAEIGIPIYPGSAAVANASGSYSQGGQTTSVAQLVTTDSTDKVVSWYAGKLAGKPQFSNMTTAQGGIMTFHSGSEIKMVTIGPGVVENKGKTVIVLGTGTGTIPQSIP